ncbi:MAG: T9SS type A sorting domain-containing protein [Microscillaceae bacterium]|nr:T9SS type A sorting domain-containing protein [Microscillaceae bacterium]
MEKERLTINPTGMGSSTIAITAIDANRGATFTEFNVLVTDFVLSTNIKNELVSIYSIPTSGSLIVEGLTSNRSYSIYNLSGVKVQEGSVRSRIDVSSLKPGIYFLSLEQDQQVLKLYIGN